MALSLILNKKSLTSFKSSFIELALDASLSEIHNRRAKITSFEVEENSAISDHIVLEPAKLTIDGFVTNTPVGILQLDSFVSKISGQPSRVQTAYDLLVKLYTTKEPFTVVTGLEVYTNMFFEVLDIPDKPEFGQSLRFTADLKQLRFVSSKTVAIEESQLKDSPEGLSDQAQSTRDVGKQVPVTPDAATATKSSFLYDAVKGVGLL